MSKHMSIIALGALSLLAGNVTFAEDDEQERGEQQDEGHFDRRLAADPKGAVIVENVAGTVKVVGTSRPEVVIEASYEEGVERIDVTSVRDRTNIKVVLEKGRHRRGGDAYSRSTYPRAARSRSGP